MANEENLKKGEQYRFRTGEEQRKIASEGGKASGASRRRKRDMRKAAQLLLDMPVSKSQATLRATMRSLGIPEEEMDYSMSVMASMLIKAANGNVNAAKLLRDTAGDNPELDLRKQELALRKAEFKYRKEQDAARAKADEVAETSLADTIEAAWRERRQQQGGEPDGDE